MRIERITLTDVRGVRSGSITFDPTGVTVVEGPNESGKSTLVAAFELLLSAAHTSRRQEVKDLQPVGRDVAPTVEAVFTVGPCGITYRKGWVRRPFAEVHVVHAGGAVEHLTGADAEARVTELLDEHVDSHLRSALNVLQASSDESVSAGRSVSVARALDRAAIRPGGDPVGSDSDEPSDAESTAPDDRSDSLAEAVSAEYLRYWTATGRPVRERQVQAEALAQAEERRNRLRERLDEVDRIHPQLEAHRNELSDRSAAIEQAEHSLGELREQLEAARRIGNEAETARAQLETQVAVLASARRAVEERSALVDTVERAREAVDASDQAIADAVPARTAADARIAELDRLVESAGASVRAATADLDLARADQTHLERQVNLAVLQERHARVVGAEEDRRRAEAILAADPVDQERLAAIEQAAAAADEARIRADAAAPVVTTTVLGTAAVNVDGDPVAASDERIVASSVTVEVPDVVRVEIVPGADVEQLAEVRDRAAVELAERCEAAGVADLAEARRSAAERSAAERDLAAAIDTVERDARDLTAAGLRELVNRLESESATYLAARPDTIPLPVDLAAAQTSAEQAQVQLDGLRAELDALEAELVTARDERRELDVAHARDESRARIESEQLSAAVAALETARASDSDDVLRDAVAAAEQSHADAARRSDDLDRQRRDAATEVLEERSRNAEGVIISSRNRSATLEREIGGLETRLEEAGRDGLSTQVDEAQSEVDHLVLSERRTEARAAAADLLHKTLERHRSESRRRYLRPLRERIEHYGRMVFGPTFEVELDDQLEVVSRRLHGEELPVSQLSVGAREQLALLVRLALASLVDAEEGAPVVIDDALGWSDRSRLELMCVALQAAGRDAQVIVLTCTPGRFAQIGGATVVTMRDDPPAVAAD